jgi:hypothetical protein
VTQRLTPLRRAYLIGLKRGYHLAQKQMHSKAETWQREIDDIQAEFEMLLDEMRCAKDERAVKEAITERAMLGDVFLN